MMMTGGGGKQQKGMTRRDAAKLLGGALVSMSPAMHALAAVQTPTPTGTDPGLSAEETRGPDA